MKRATFSHYSDKPLVAMYSVDQLTFAHFKPQGLWLSVDGPDDWPAWCTINNFGADKFVHRYRVTLDRSKILWLRNADALHDFSQEFAADLPGLSRDELHWVIVIDWQRVAQRHAGIVIAPFLWGCRLSLPWYYAWDCASGCMWDPAAVRRIRKLGASKARKR